MRLLIVIVNYRTPELTVDCLKSVEPELADIPDARVTVTDNLSPDDSLVTLARAIESNGWSKWCTLMPLPKNGGFAYGNNQAIHPSLTGPDSPELVLLLNPDTLVLPGALRELMKFMDASPDVGIAGARCENRDGSVRRSAFRFHSIRGEFERGANVGIISKILKNQITAPPLRNDLHRVDWVSGACMMVRRSVFKKIGLMYYEETDFCLRAARAGFACWYVPAARIIHLVGQSSGVTGAAKALKRRPKYWFDARHRYFLRNYGVLKTLAADFAWGCGLLIGRTWDVIRWREPYESPRLFRDFVRFNLLSWGQGK